MVKHKKKKHTEDKSGSHEKKQHKKDEKSKKKESNFTWLWVGAVVVVLIIALVLLNIGPQNQQPSENEKIIKEVQQLALSAEDALEELEGEVDQSVMAEIKEEIDQLQEMLSENDNDAAEISSQIDQVNKEIIDAGIETNQELSEVVSKLTAAKMELSGESEASTTEKVKLDFYVMSQCPYGTQVVDAIAPVLEKIGDNVNFNLNYIANDNGDGTFKSLHGQPEVEGDIVQLCAIKYNPDKYMEMLVCQNQNAGAIPGNWESCASENGLDVENIRACFEGEEGKELLKASITETQKVGATGSPTIYVNDGKYAGGRGENDFMRALCNAFEKDKPGACAEIPEPAKVNIIVLNDKRCAECDITQLLAQLKGVFPGMVVESYDYSDAEGKKLFDETGVGLLPAILFDESVNEAENFANVQNYLVPAGDYTSLRIGAVFDPTAEICDNEIDDTGNGKVDCEDDTCSGTLLCRKEIEDHLQVFVMSDCPYGRQAIVALKAVVDNFEDDMDYEVHYIASESGDGFSSLHGQYEVDEDIVQLCVKEYSPAVWLDYIFCRSENGVRDVDWKTCAQESGVVVDKVEACSQGDEGKDLLREDIKIAQSLSISASPTWLANNKFTFSGIDGEKVKTSFCSYNEDLKGCGNTLTTVTGDVVDGQC